MGVLNRTKHREAAASSLRRGIAVEEIPSRQQLIVGDEVQGLLEIGLKHEVLIQDGVGIPTGVEK